MNTTIKPVIRVLEEKCVNCHMCISVCPVKYCIDGSGDKVRLNHELCIGCGSCITACTHGARQGMDDFDLFMEQLRKGEKMIAVVAPAVAAKFPDHYLQFNGWLRSLGVEAVFDVAFGAELTVESYLRHVKANAPALVIAQPCPAIVTYIEIYQSELLPYLAPADSPMLHAIKAAREFLPQYRNHRIAIISPCVAKRREFDETGIGDYNVTLERISDHLKEKNIRLQAFEATNFDNPPAERAVLFSSPGGLKETVEREVPGLSVNIRKMEGPEAIYPYLKELPESIKKKVNPLILDCLNCEKGCNGGTGTGSQEVPVDILEASVRRRDANHRKLLEGSGPMKKDSAKAVHKGIASWWKDGLFARNYVNRSAAQHLAMPSEAQFKDIYKRMRKFRKEDHLNCASCGYDSCEGMAVAIHNGLNKFENCQHYRNSVLEMHKQSLTDMSKKLDVEIANSKNHVGSVMDMLPELARLTEIQAKELEDADHRIGSILIAIKQSSALSSERQDNLTGLLGTANSVQAELAASLGAVQGLKKQMDGIHSLVAGIDDIATQTNLLSMNAAIEAAHAGSAGKGFAVVASEIRKLSTQAGQSAMSISKTIASMAKEMDSANEITKKSGADIRNVLGDLNESAAGMKEIFDSLASMSSETDGIGASLKTLTATAGSVRKTSGTMQTSLRTVSDEIAKIAQISRENTAKLE